VLDIAAVVPSAILQDANAWSLVLLYSDLVTTSRPRFYQKILLALISLKQTVIIAIRLKSKRGGNKIASCSIDHYPTVVNSHSYFSSWWLNCNLLWICDELEWRYRHLEIFGSKWTVASISNASDKSEWFLRFLVSMFQNPSIPTRNLQSLETEPLQNRFQGSMNHFNQINAK